jgi:rare lipoprotein A
MNRNTALILLAAVSLAACSSAPTRTGQSGYSGGYLAGDGPGTEDAAKLAAVPDAVPRAEPLNRYANRPYEALGVGYEPLTTLGTYKERGIASWYGKKFHGQRTSSGEVYDMYGMTAAHKTLPIPSYARVTSLGTGKSVIVRVNDRGPFARGRIMDVSYAAAYKLGILGSGSGEVEVESLAPGQNPRAPTVVAQPVQAEPVPVEPLHTEPVRDPAIQPGTVYLQLGSFRSPQGAESFLAHMRDELSDFGKQLVLYTSGGLSRVHLGPYRTTDEARASANQLESRLGFKPFVSIH